MAIDVATLSIEQLETLIQNHRAKKATGQPLFVEALAELQRRRGRGLAFEKSFPIIRSAAEQGRFLSYKELADASGADWNSVYYSLGGHRWNLVEFANLKGWPMLSAIVVNKEHVATGKMQPDTLEGFVTAARGLGYTVHDGEAFLREQQQKVFEWARSVPDRVGQKG